MKGMVLLLGWVGNQYGRLVSASIAQIRPIGLQVRRVLDSDIDMTCRHYPVRAGLELSTRPGQ
jgi:hypothetical protein